MFRGNKVMGRTIAVVSTVALAAGMSIAVSTTSQAATGEVKSISKLVPADIKAKGSFTSVGAAYPPAFINNKGKLTGWDVETIREVAKVLGLTVKITDIAFAGVVPGVQSGKFDTAMGEIYINTNRLAQVDFVTTHNSGDTLMVPVNSPIKSAKTALSLCGYSLGATTGSAEAAAIQSIVDACKEAKEDGTQLRAFATAPEMLLALNQGRVQAIVNSASQAAYEVKVTAKNNKPKYRVVDTPFIPGTLSGIAVSKDKPELTKAIAAAVNYLIKNGKLKAINKKFNEGLGMITESVIMTK